MGEYDAPVVADEATLTDLQFYVDEGYDTHTLVQYAAGRGVTPPSKPEGFDNWSIAVRYLPGEDEGRLYGLGPDDEKKTRSTGKTPGAFTTRLTRDLHSTLDGSCAQVRRRLRWMLSSPTGLSRPTVRSNTASWRSGTGGSVRYESGYTPWVFALIGRRVTRTR